LFEKYKIEEMSTISNEAREFFGDEYIYNNYTSKGKTTLEYDDALKVVASYSAAPGTSEHQTGLCVDFVTEEYGDCLDLSFEETAAFDWLQENAYKFGFILRYPKDKVATTGYSYEPWHYRFVGREAATDIHFSGLCLEEYLGQMQS
jgi:D-alanyl-D-alanine carboxypeptidase